LLLSWQEKDEKLKWNKLQNFCADNRDENIIVVANTGMGKTEAGLLWIGDNKGFFILPLRTAINAIYDRIKTNIVKEKLDKRVALLHSDTLSYYLKEDIVEEDKILEYAKKGKQLSMPLTISTLDQLFNFVYKYNGFELKLATLSYSKIVIDEIQAYSPDLLAYLVYGLEKITEVGGKFAILTATLPPFIRDYIEINIKGIKFDKFTKGKTRHYLKAITEKMDSVFISDHYKKNGGKILVVCNTVKKAQEIYSELKPCADVKLIHSKYIKKDRSEKEAQIIAFGKTKVKENGIWVATSIVEASLDIDFDYLFTELNDLNGLFQRLGRVNRKGEKDNMLDSPNAFVFTEIDDALLTNEDGSRGFIDRTIYKLSKEAISGYNGLLPEEDKVNRIEKYLTTQKIKNSNFCTRYKIIKNYIEDLYIGEKNLKEVQKMFRNISSYTVIPESVYIDNKQLIDDNMKIIEEKFVFDDMKCIEENKINKDKLYLKNIKAKEEIYALTVAVGLYDLNEIKGKSIKFGYEEIKINKCNYSADIGFERVAVKKNKEESFDNCM